MSSATITLLLLGASILLALFWYLGTHAGPEWVEDDEDSDLVGYSDGENCRGPH